MFMIHLLREDLYYHLNSVRQLLNPSLLIWMETQYTLEMDLVILLHMMSAQVI